MSWYNQLKTKIYRVETVQGDFDPDFNIIHADHGCIHAQLFPQNEDDNL